MVHEEIPLESRSDVTLRQLAHFVAAVEHGTISGAAEHLHFSPSAVSASITELERALGAQLCVRRRAQGITLTPTGRAVCERARRLLADAKELALAAGGDGSELRGPLSIGCFATLASALLPRILEEYRERHPDVAIDFVVGSQDELWADLRDGRLDAAIMYDIGAMDGIDRFELHRTRAYAVMGERHPLASRDAVSLEELVEHPFLLYDQSPSATYALGIFEERGLTPTVQHRTRDFELTRCIVARSDSAYAILVQRPTNTLTYEGLPVVEKEIVPAPPDVAVVFAWAADARPSPRGAALAQLVREQYAPRETPAG